MIRAFIAIDLPKAFHDEVGRLTTELRRCGADVKWVRPESVHLTLKFLGDTLEDDVEPVAEAVSKVTAAYGPMALASGGLGVFPERGAPRVVWIGLTGDIAPLAAMQKDIEACAAPFGYVPEKRPFKAHLTLGRARSGRGRGALMAALSKTETKRIDFTARDVVLFKSDLKPSGAIYTALRRLPLGAQSTEEESA